MIEEDNEGFGLNAYNSKIEDPSSTNCINSSINENVKKVQILHYKNNKIKSMVDKIIKNEPLGQ